MSICVSWKESSLYNLIARLALAEMVTQPRAPHLSWLVKPLHSWQYICTFSCFSDVAVLLQAWPLPMTTLPARMSKIGSSSIALTKSVVFTTLSAAFRRQDVRELLSLTCRISRQSAYLPSAHVSRILPESSPRASQLFTIARSGARERERGGNAATEGEGADTLRFHYPRCDCGRRKGWENNRTELRL